MKKISYLLCFLLLISACGSKDKESKHTSHNDDKQVVCQLEENADAGVKVTYSYDEKGNITYIHNVSYLHFSEDDLATASLDDYFEQIKTQYAAAEGESGVSIQLSKDTKNNRIEMDVTINIALYNLEDDILNVANDGEMDNIKDLVELYNAMGVYKCGKVEID
ncbi:MAG: hypothetical protein EOM50_05210 [Erysipelotrichia bacterium]|nr:hypothetical protein [Erysipelotrichia bacterium]NCC54718.1 hypothetical protein [Erysipelotrichia bacterium]